MCNLYNVTTNQQAIIDFSRALRDLSGNLDLSLDIYPDYPAPIVRNAPDGVRELARVRWGCRVPAMRFFRQLKSARPHWRPRENRSSSYPY